MLPDDLPQDFLEFNARFGTDEQCRKYLIKARWPDGFRCAGLFGSGPERFVRWGVAEGPAARLGR